jgi:hypothetical protein
MLLKLMRINVSVLEMKVINFILNNYDYDEFIGAGLAQAV